MERRLSPGQLAAADQLHAEVTGTTREGVKDMIEADPSAAAHNYPEIARQIQDGVRTKMSDSKTFFKREPTEMEARIINESFGGVLFLLSPKGAFGETKLPDVETAMKVLGWTLDSDPEVQIANLDNWLVQCVARLGCYPDDLRKAKTSEERLEIFSRDLLPPPSNLESTFWHKKSN